MIVFSLLLMFGDCLGRMCWWIDADQKGGKQDSFMLHDGSHSGVGNAMCVVSLWDYSTSKVRRDHRESATRCPEPPLVLSVSHEGQLMKANHYESESEEGRIASAWYQLRGTSVSVCQACKDKTNMAESKQIAHTAVTLVLLRTMYETPSYTDSYEQFPLSLWIPPGNHTHQFAFRAGLGLLMKNDNNNNMFMVSVLRIRNFIHQIFPSLPSLALPAWLLALELITASISRPKPRWRLDIKPGFNTFPSWVGNRYQRTRYHLRSVIICRFFPAFDKGKIPCSCQPWLMHCSRTRQYLANTAQVKHNVGAYFARHGLRITNYSLRSNQWTSQRIGS